MASIDKILTADVANNGTVVVNYNNNCYVFIKTH